MPQARSKKQDSHDALEHLYPRLREGGLIALVAVCIYLSLALFSFDPEDPGWTYTGSDRGASNLVGLSGAWVADVFLTICGYMAFIFPIMLGFQSLQMFRDRKIDLGFSWAIFSFRSLGLILTLTAGAGIAALHFYDTGLHFRQGSGGIIGLELSELMVPIFSYIGTTLILLSVFLFGLTAFADISWLALMDGTGRLTMRGIRAINERWQRILLQRAETEEVKQSTQMRREALERHVEQNQQRPALVIEAPPPVNKEVSERGRS